MKTRQTTLCIALLGSLLASSAAWADKPSWAGGGKDRYEREDRDDRHDRDRYRDDDRRDHGRRGPDDDRRGGFDNDRRSLIRDYYGQEFRRGNCPPGLAKKNNGCLPPGQAKKWAMGRPLPRDVLIYDLPPDLLRQLGRTPEGYKYVRVASDILMVAVGTNMVVDAITDLNR